MQREFFEADDGVGAGSDPSLPHSDPLTSRLRCVVAIPVKDEAERLPACLAALAEQRERSGRPLDPESFGVVVFANNCRDGSAEIARALGEQLSLGLRVVEVTLPPEIAHAGGARRGAMDNAERWLASERGADGVILTTDADSRVSPNWIVANLAEIDAGADAVLGDIRLDEEGDPLPEALHLRGRLEDAYQALLAETSALIDPIAHDPWPHHAMIAGASIAIRRDVYVRIGGLPSIPLGEDKALVAALLRSEAKVRHSPEVLVTTSGRRQGRAPGGVADTLRLRSRDPFAICDEALERYAIAFARAKWKTRLRAWWRSGDRELPPAWLRILKISRARVASAAASPTFGAAWDEIESDSPLLVRRPIAPDRLPREIAVARRGVERLRAVVSATNEHVEAEFSLPIAALEVGAGIHGGNEDFGGLVA